MRHLGRKNCENCGAEFVQRYTCSASEWAIQRACSPSCASKICDRTHNGTLEERIAEKFIALSKDECWEWTGAKSKRGYGLILDKGKMRQAHRIVASLRFGLLAPGIVVRHRCDNPSCGNIFHLEIGTQAENVRDRVERGREGDRSGGKNGNAKLSDRAVREIRASSLPIKILAGQFGVSPGVVSKVRRYAAWKHIT